MPGRLYPAPLRRRLRNWVLARCWQERVAATFDLEEQDACTELGVFGDPVEFDLVTERNFCEGYMTSDEFDMPMYELGCGAGTS